MPKRLHEYFISVQELMSYFLEQAYDVGHDHAYIASATIAERILIVKGLVASEHWVAYPPD